MDCCLETSKLRTAKSVGRQSDKSMVGKSSSSSSSKAQRAGSFRPGQQTDANAKHIISVSREEARRLGPGKTDWGYVDRVTDAEIAEAVCNDPDALRIDIDWSKAKLLDPRPKKALNVRLDRDVLEFFRGGGRGYQTKINAVLRSYMEHELKKQAKKRA